MDFPSEKMTHFKRKFSHSPAERNSVKPSKAQKMMDHLVTLLEYASQDIERAQYEPGSHFSKLVEVCGSKKKAKLSFIQDRFDTVIVPWLERHKIDSALIDQFRSDMSMSYTKILNRANVNPSRTISTEFASNLRDILAHIDVTQALNPSSPGMNT